MPFWWKPRRPDPEEALRSHLSDFRHLKKGRRYRVVRAFVDYDGGEHPVGETWTFQGHSFLPYDDGLSLFFSTDGSPIRQIRMRWTPEDQGPVIDVLEKYVRPDE